MIGGTALWVRSHHPFVQPDYTKYNQVMHILPTRNSPARLSQVALFITACVFAMTLPTLHAKADTPEVIRLQIDPAAVVSRISPDFIGFGYETSAVAQPDFFSVKNTSMLQLYRTLSSHGLIRIGGNVSDHTRYTPDGTAAAQSQTGTSVINGKCLADLGEFARKSGWHVMWGLNLGTGSKQEAAAEAVAVANALGDHLQSFQIGNEVDYLPRFKGHFDDYHAAYIEYKNAVREAQPSAVFSGPDVAGNVTWLDKFASSESSDLKLLTHHYYVGGARDKGTSIEKMLKHDDRWEQRLQRLQQVATGRKLEYRINEVNSFSGGGKLGVSDTFASALWCVDYMFQLASYGCAGVNMETDINHLAWISHYSPIVHDEKGKCTARPEYYGMLAFSIAGQGDMLKCTIGDGGIKPSTNCSAYATRDPSGALWITVVNKDAQRDLTVEVAVPSDKSHVRFFALSAESIQSTDHVSFGGSEVMDDGTWNGRPTEKDVTAAPNLSITVPHASAMIARLAK